VRVTTVEHRGKSLEVAGIVVSPDTMETSVASAIDEHYAERFVLPAAAAFVSGLGQALAYSNATTIVSPFGGTSTQFGQLNFKQQLGVCAAQRGLEISVEELSAKESLTVIREAMYREGRKTAPDRQGGHRFIGGGFCASSSGGART
jgi:hypothetical protein